ncbi:MAG: pyridoxine 5'-phosphate synthase [Proteobacteria bacterium]|nr:pyridoxine 5'-phosphate synthase [Pseudomonadota bacterium]
MTLAVLSVNLNKVALIRNSRDGQVPSVVQAARTVLAAGAHGITVHPRPDQRHIRPGDVNDLAKLLADYPEIEFNIEGNPFAGPRDNGYPGFDALDGVLASHRRPGGDIRGTTANLDQLQ